MRKVWIALLIAPALISLAGIAAMGKPISASPSLTLDPGSDLTFGGQVTFTVTGLPPRVDAKVDIQCFGSIPGGVDNVGWWDTGDPSKVFVLGSQPTTAPPDMGNIIVLQWDGSIPLECDARLFRYSKKGLTVYDTESFVTQ